MACIKMQGEMQAKTVIVLRFYEENNESNRASKHVIGSGLRPHSKFKYYLLNRHCIVGGANDARLESLQIDTGLDKCNVWKNGHCCLGGIFHKVNLGAFFFGQESGTGI